MATCLGRHLPLGRSEHMIKHRRNLGLLVTGVALALTATGCGAAVEAASQAMYAEDCSALAAQAAELFAEEGELLKVREPKVKEDKRSTFDVPTTGEATRLTCTGMGVWGDGSASSPVLLTETVDSDGDQFVAWEAL